jgi:hypothetical protein
MRIVVLDSVGCSVGRPAQFSAPTVAYLRARGHDVVPVDGFDVDRCAAADAVWTEWANEDAFAAAVSGVCRRLVVRLRGYEVWGPLERLAWQNVHALVCESTFLRDLLPPALPTRVEVIPAGLDLKRWAAYAGRPRGPGNVVALVGRIDGLKGYQLALEWARRRPDLQLHVTLADAMLHPRETRYVRETAPSNVVVHDEVDTVSWLDGIGANYLLSASMWESLGYTIVEAMALGIKPLIHDRPGARQLWPTDLLWRGFADLDRLVTESYEPERYRALAAAFDADQHSSRFEALLTEPSPQVGRGLAGLFARVDETLQRGQVELGEQLTQMFRQTRGEMPDENAVLAVRLAARYYEAGTWDRARTWALRALSNGPRRDAAFLLGLIAEEQEDFEEALRWFETASGVPEVPTLFALPIEVDLPEARARVRRLLASDAEGRPFDRVPSPPRYVVVVPVRNAAPWITRCLASIMMQDGFRDVATCVVVDDGSTDGTFERARAMLDAGAVPAAGFELRQNVERKWSLRSIVDTIRTVPGDPEDVIVIVDGDDWLADETVFTRLNQAYRAGAWLTYGSFVQSDGQRSWMGAYPRKHLVAGTTRRLRYSASHLKTFKRFLFDALTDDDLKIDGAWPQITGDVALMLPLLDLARERAFHIPDTLYVYNVDNPANDHKQDPAEQVRVRNLIFARPALKRFVR